MDKETVSGGGGCVAKGAFESDGPVSHHRAALIETFGSCEIHKVQCAVELGVAPLVDTLEIEREDGVRSRGLGVHVGAADGTLLGGACH